MTRHITLDKKWNFWRRTLITLAIVSATVIVRAEYSFLPDSLDGSMMPYDFMTTDSSPNVPDSLEVVHVAYVARHGARYLSSDKKVSSLSDILRPQMTGGTITTDGKDFLSLLDTISEISKSKWGALSDIGIQEEIRLGIEIATMFPELMKEGDVKAKSSYVPRVVMTMYQYLHSLGKEKQRLDISTIAGHSTDSLLRCFEAFRDYSQFRDSGKWKSVYDDFMLRHVSPAPARRVFGTIDLPMEKAQNLTMDMYGVLQGLRAMGLDGPTDRFMTEEEYRECWETSNLERYLRNTVNSLSSSCAGATSMLIEDIIHDCDRWQGHQSPGSPLTAWFGHAETLMPMLSVMDVPGCYYFTDDWDSVASHWLAEDVVPLGANFMIILMKPKSGSDTVYVSVRLNGHNTPPWPGAPAIVTWESLKSHWLNRIAEFSKLYIGPE